MRSGRRRLAVPLALAALLALGGCGDIAAPRSSAPSFSPTPGPSAPSSPGATAAPATASPTPATSSAAPATPAPTESPSPSPTPARTVAPTPTPALRVGKVAYVAVTVATGWRSPASPRAVDAPALANPVRIRAWLAALSREQQAGLIGRVDTQVLLGDRVLVTELRTDWARVVVPDQATPLDKRGYPVWIPRRQLTAVAPAAPDTAEVATIIEPTAWLESEEGARSAEASFGTRLPVLARAATRVQVALPGARSAWLASASVSIRPKGDGALTPTEASTIARAKQFVGRRYLWGGTSGFGFDCSGIVYLVYRVHGVLLPRDAEPQSKVGSAVPDDSRRPGDLVFFSRDGEVHHVAIWLGGGSILEAPNVGAPVRVMTLSGLPYRTEVSRVSRVLD